MVLLVKFIRQKKPQPTACHDSREPENSQNPQSWRLSSAGKSSNSGHWSLHLNVKYTFNHRKRYYIHDHMRFFVKKHHIYSLFIIRLRLLYIEHELRISAEEALIWITAGTAIRAGVPENQWTPSEQSDVLNEFNSGVRVLHWYNLYLHTNSSSSACSVFQTFTQISFGDEIYGVAFARKNAWEYCLHISAEQESFRNGLILLKSSAFLI